MFQLQTHRGNAVWPICLPHSLDVFTTNTHIHVQFNLLLLQWTETQISGHSSWGLFCEKSDVMLCCLTIRSWSSVPAGKVLAIHLSCCFLLSRLYYCFVQISKCFYRDPVQVNILLLPRPGIEPYDVKHVFKENASTDGNKNTACFIWSGSYISYNKFSYFTLSNVHT